VDNPSNSPADAAYGRALAAFQEAVRLDPQNDDYKSHLQAARERLAAKK